MDIDEEGAAKAAAEVGGRAWRADVADVERMREVVEEIVNAFGGLHILVNNAGINTGADWARVNGSTGENEQSPFQSAVREKGFVLPIGAWALPAEQSVTDLSKNPNQRQEAYKHPKALEDHIGVLSHEAGEGTY